MNRVELGKILDRLVNNYRDPTRGIVVELTKIQIEEWWRAFAGEPFERINRAVDFLIDEYGYFPVPATLKSYVEKVKDIEEYEAESKKPKIEKPTLEDLDRHQRWMRYFWWILETRQFPRTPEEAMKAKERFEKERPDWQPVRRREEKRGMQPIGTALGESFRGSI